jgi:hypothetical protein
MSSHRMIYLVATRKVVDQESGEVLAQESQLFHPGGDDVERIRSYCKWAGEPDPLVEVDFEDEDAFQDRTKEVLMAWKDIEILTYFYRH